MKTILSATCVNFGGLQYFFLIFHFSFSLFFPVTVLVLFWSFVHTLLCILFFFLLWFIPFFFLILPFGSPFSSYFWVKPIACVCLFVLFCLFLSFPLFFSFLPTFSFSQHWNTGGSHPEELERPGAHPRLKARPQPPLFYSFISSEPQFTDCVALSEHSIPGDQITLQINIIMKIN